MLKLGASPALAAIFQTINLNLIVFGLVSSETCPHQSYFGQTIGALHPLRALLSFISELRISIVTHEGMRFPRISSILGLEVTSELLTRETKYQR